MFWCEYLCIYRPVWRDASSEGYPPTPDFNVAIAQLSMLFRARSGLPVRIVDDAGREMYRLKP